MFAVSYCKSGVNARLRSVAGNMQPADASASSHTLCGRSRVRLRDCK